MAELKISFEMTPEEATAMIYLLDETRDVHLLRPWEIAAVNKICAALAQELRNNSRGS